MQVVAEPKSQGVPDFQAVKIFSFDGYKKHNEQNQRINRERFLFNNSLIPKDQLEFKFTGYCYVCKDWVSFNYPRGANNLVNPNWREGLACPICRLNNRMRATVHLFDTECQPMPDAKIYLTEQVTRLYSVLKAMYPNTCGSEYMGDSLAYGGYNQKGVRNEDLTKLSFNNDEFDFILSFDVLEHIPNYKKALSECYRCLKPGGSLFFSVPFVTKAEKNIIRACINDNGGIEHLLPPEYHGDPVNSAGVLCYTHFGWQLLEELNEIGFENAQALLFWSKEFGYLGMEQIQFKATKSF